MEAEVDARVARRTMAGRAGWLVLVVMATLIEGCAAATPTSQLPSADGTSVPPAMALETPEPSIPATTSPAASTATPILATSAPVLSAFGDGWPLILAGSWDVDPPFVVAPDGTAYAWTAKPDESAVLVAVDPAGRMRPGWPFEPPSGSSPATLDVASDASVLAGTFDAERREFTLHRIGPDGREVAGWPFRESSLCPYHPIEVVEAADGTVYVGGCPEDATAVEIAALDPAGRSVDGWPVRIDEGRSSPGLSWDLQVTPAGTVHVLTSPSDSVGPARLWAFSADGRARPGWPVTLEASMAGFLVAPGDRVLVVSYIRPDGPPVNFECRDARETIISELDARGTPVAGWPRVEEGWASWPVVAPDGTVYYLMRGRVVARAPDGSVPAGWPVELVDLYPECGGAAAYLAPDGTLYVVTDDLRAYDPDGNLKPGWPFRPAGGFASWPCHSNAVLPAPTIGTDGVFYIATRATSTDPTVAGQAEITALDAQGSVLPGWPYPMPLAWEIGPDGDYLDAAEGQRPGGVRDLAFAEGRLYATALVCAPDQEWSGMLLLALDRDGSGAE
jgi:hypothetical protein